MVSITGWKTLVEKNLLGKGSIIGVADTPMIEKVYHRFVVENINFEKNGNTIVDAVHLQTNVSVKMNIQNIIEVDGMNLDRYLDHADLDVDGNTIISGKKRGRKKKSS